MDKRKHNLRGSEKSFRPNSHIPPPAFASVSTLAALIITGLITPDIDRLEGIPVASL